VVWRGLDQPIGWAKAYRYLFAPRRRRRAEGPGGSFWSLGYGVLCGWTNRKGEVQELMEFHDQRGAAGKTDWSVSVMNYESSSHGGIYGELGLYVVPSWPTICRTGLRDLYCRLFIEEAHQANPSMCGLIAAKVVEGSRQIRLKIFGYASLVGRFCVCLQKIPLAFPAFHGG